MKKKILFFCAVSSFQFGHAQEVISNLGNSQSVPQYAMLDYTLGEIITNTLSNGNNDLTQGFHQTNWTFVSIENLNSDFSVLVYPNPFAEELILELPDGIPIKCQLFDAQGKIIFEQEVTSQKSVISTTDLSNGAYSLVLRDQKNLKTINLIKNQ